MPWSQTRRSVSCLASIHLGVLIQSLVEAVNLPFQAVVRQRGCARKHGENVHRTRTPSARVREFEVYLCGVWNENSPKMANDDGRSEQLRNPAPSHILAGEDVVVFAVASIPIWIPGPNVPDNGGQESLGLP